MMLDFIQENNFSEPGMPRYRALAGVLRSGILSGRLADGTKFPPEAEFAAMLGINHRTLRAGLKLLADECLISQSRGRGTFVTYARKKHLKVGVLLGDPHTLTNDIYMLRLLAGLSQAIDNNPDSELHFMTSPEPEKVFELLQRRECHALIVLDRDPAMACRLCRSEFKSMPIIFVNPQSSELAEDNRYEVDIAPGGAADCVRYLYELGHRKIGFISACGTLDLRVATQNREFRKPVASWGFPVLISVCFRRKCRGMTLPGKLRVNYFRNLIVRLRYSVRDLSFHMELGKVCWRSDCGFRRMSLCSDLTAIPIAIRISHLLMLH